MGLKYILPYHFKVFIILKIVDNSDEELWYQVRHISNTNKQILQQIATPNQSGLQEMHKTVGKIIYGSYILLGIDGLFTQLDACNLHSNGPFHLMIYKNLLAPAYIALLLSCKFNLTSEFRNSNHRLEGIEEELEAKVVIESA